MPNTLAICLWVEESNYSIKGNLHPEHINIYVNRNSSIIHFHNHICAWRPDMKPRKHNNNLSLPLVARQCTKRGKLDGYNKTQNLCKALIRKCLAQSTLAKQRADGRVLHREHSEVNETTILKTETCIDHVGYT